MRQIDKINFVSSPEKVFRNIEHYKKVRMAILSALSKAKSKKNNSNKSSSYLINRITVKFLESVKYEEIYLDYESGQIVLEAPKILKGSRQNETERRMYYFSNLLKSVEAIATIGITHIYLVLSEEGRAELELQELEVK